MPDNTILYMLFYFYVLYSAIYTLGNPETNHAHIPSHAQSMAGGFRNIENGLASRLHARN